MRNKFLAVLVIWRFLFKSLLHRVSSSVSITALIPFKKLFESRNGVGPGTIAIRKDTFPRGINNARLLTNVWWLPKRKTKLHFTCLTCSRISWGRLANKSGTCLSPITVWEAPMSTTPTVPEDANNVSWKMLSTPGDKSSEGHGFESFTSGLTLSEAGCILHINPGCDFPVWFLINSLSLFLAGHFFKGLDNMMLLATNVSQTCPWKSSAIKTSGRSSSWIIVKEGSFTSTKDVGIVEAADDDACEFRSRNWGHSFFQCPFLWHTLQYDDAIRLASVCLPRPLEPL